MTRHAPTAGPGTRRGPQVGVSVATAIGVLLLSGASGLHAQAICSAPHSAPTLATGGGLGTLVPGTGWAMLSAVRQSSTEFFNTAGTSQPFLADGRFVVSSAYLSAAVGLRPGLELWSQVPVHRMSYADLGGRRERHGIGDLRVAFRISPQLVGLRAPVSLRVGAKLPGSTFPVDATIIPLTEGQRDVELAAESGYFFAETSVYVLGWVGHRWRGENTRAARKPGDESFAHLGVGGVIGGVRLEIGVDQLWGQTPRQLGFPVNAQRRMLQVSPTIARAAGPGHLEATAILPVGGRNLPTGAAVSVGYRLPWSLHRAPANTPSVVPLPAGEPR